MLSGRKVPRRMVSLSASYASAPTRLSLHATHVVMWRSMHSGGMTWVPGSGSIAHLCLYDFHLLKVRKQVWYEGLYASVSVARTFGTARLPRRVSPEPLAMLAPREPWVEGPSLSLLTWVKPSFKDPPLCHEGVPPIPEHILRSDREPALVEESGPAKRDDGSCSDCTSARATPRPSSEAEPYAGRERSLMCEGMGATPSRTGKAYSIGVPCLFA